MNALRLKTVLRPWVTTRTWAPWAIAPKRTNELRELERRVAAARGTVGSAQRTIQEWPYEDLP